MCHIHLRDGGRGPPATVPVAALTAGTKAIYWLRIAISAYPPAFDAPVRGVPVGISLSRPFGTEKLGWCGYPIHERDRHTHTHTNTA